MYRILSSRSLPLSLSHKFNITNIRGIKTLKFGNVNENIVEKSDYPRKKVHEILNDENITVLGYGPQGRSQALNMIDNGFNVKVGLRKGGSSWKKAISDGFIENDTLFPLIEAVKQGTIIMNLLSDAGQKQTWNELKNYITKGKTLYFSHGFSIVYSDQTKVIPSNDIDVIMVAPKGSGTTLRKSFKEGKGVNSSVAIYQDVSGKAKDKAYSLGISIGSGYMYDTTFEKEVFSDLFGERGILMGAICGLFHAQYQILREKGHSPSEAFNETVEEATQSLIPLISENGMDWMFANCSTTAQRGALDWYPKFRDNNLPLFRELYDKVQSGEETRRVLTENSKSNYKEKLNKELKKLHESEIWKAGKVVRSLRPKEKHYYII